MSEAPALVEVGRREAAGLDVSGMYERHARTLYGLCRMLLRDPHDAEDALQATFLAAHGALLRGSAPRDEAAWLATIARNECRGRIRTTMKGPTNAGDEPLLGLADPAPTPEERLGDPEVSRALAQLPESQREAVVLHDVFGFKAREVGKVLGMSVPAVEALLFRGRRQLRLRLRPAQGALVVPLGVREALAAAIPGFAGGDGATLVAGGAGIAGAGLIAKLAGAPAAAKVAAGIAAVATAGSVAVVETERARDDGPRPARVETAGSDGTPTSGTLASALPGGSGVSGSSDAGRSGGHGSSGPSGDGDEGDRSGPRAGEAGDDDDSGSGSGRGDRSGSSGDEADDRDDDSPSSSSGDPDSSGKGSGDEGEDRSPTEASDDGDDDDRSGSDDGPEADDDDSGSETSGSSDDDAPDADDGSDSGSGGSGSSGSDGGDDEPDVDESTSSGSGSGSSDSGSGGDEEPDEPDDDTP